MTTLLLVRHGETVDNVRQIMQGQTQGELTPNGIEQARALRASSDSMSSVHRASFRSGMYLPVKLPQSRSRSSFVCTMASGDTPCAAASITHVSKARFRSLDTNTSMGMSFSSAARARAAAFLQFVRDNYEGKTVLAVGHGITNKAIRSVHSGTPMNETPRMANAEVVTMQL